MGKLSPFRLGMSELDETCSIGKRKYQDTIGQFFRFIGDEIVKFHLVEVWPTKQSQIRVFEGTFC